MLELEELLDDEVELEALDELETLDELDVEELPDELLSVSDELEEADVLSAELLEEVLDSAELDVLLVCSEDEEAVELLGASEDVEDTLDGVVELLGVSEEVTLLLHAVSVSINVTDKIALKIFFFIKSPLKSLLGL